MSFTYEEFTFSMWYWIRTVHIGMSDVKLLQNNLLGVEIIFEQQKLIYLKQHFSICNKHETACLNFQILHILQIIHWGLKGNIIYENNSKKYLISFLKKSLIKKIVATFFLSQSNIKVYLRVYLKMIFMLLFFIKEKKRGNQTQLIKSSWR